MHIFFGDGYLGNQLFQYSFIKSHLKPKILLTTNKTLSNGNTKWVDGGYFNLYLPLKDLGHEVYFWDTVEPDEPDYQKVIPKDNDKSLLVPLNDFISSVERVVSVSIDRKEGVKLDIHKGKLNLSVNSTNSGDGNEVIPAKYDYEEITIGFNSKYLLDIASVIESKNIQLKFKN